VSYYYTAFSPTDTAVTVLRRTLDQALDMAAVDLARGWLPIHIVFDHGQLNRNEIVTYIQERQARPLFLTKAPLLASGERRRTEGEKRRTLLEQLFGGRYRHVRSMLCHKWRQHRT
jgi:hypothetical protein